MCCCTINFSSLLILSACAAEAPTTPMSSPLDRSATLHPLSKKAAGHSSERPSATAGSSDSCDPQPSVTPHQGILLAGHGEGTRPAILLSAVSSTPWKGMWKCPSCWRVPLFPRFKGTPFYGRPRRTDTPMWAWPAQNHCSSSLLMSVAQTRKLQMCREFGLCQSSKVLMRGNKSNAQTQTRRLKLKLGQSNESLMISCALVVAKGMKP